MEFNEMFDIKNKEDVAKSNEVNITKHVSVRLGILIGTIILFFVVLSILDKHSGALAALYLSLFFYGIWFFCIIVETIILYILKKNEKGSANLVLIIILALLSALTYYNFD